MKTTEEILQILREAKPGLEARYRVGRIALCGSYARGDQQEGSDVDVLVDVGPSIGLRFVALADEIERMIGLRAEVVSRRAIG